MKPTNPLESVYFIALPEGFSLTGCAMHIDPAIPLPVQRRDGDQAGTPDFSTLAPEQILSGLLTVMAYDAKHPYMQYYRSVLKAARPDIKKELCEAAVLKAKNEDFDLAEEIFCALHGFDPDDMAIVLNMALFFDQRADSYRRNGLTEDADAYDDSALLHYKEAMQAEPEIPDAFFNAGFFYMKKRDYTEAKGCFETYLALTCDTSDDDLGENGVYKKTRAQEVLNDIAAMNMEDEHFKAAYDYINRGEEEKGLEEIRIFLQRNPGVWNAWFMLGWGLRKLGRYDDALQAFEKSLTCEGGEAQADTYNELAICWMERGDTAKAKKCLETALARDPENTKIISNLGFLALKEGDPALAARYFQIVLEYAPNDTIARSELEKLDV